MELGLNGRTALVTGASAGLGFAAALELAREGVDLIINSRAKDRINAAADRITKETGRRPTAIAVDISTKAGVSELLSKIKETGKRVEILVSNTGGPPPGQFLDLGPEQFDQAGQLLLDSAVELTRGFLPGMIKRKWGRLIYITSIAVLQPVDTLLLSNTYRAAITGFCKTVSNNYAVHGITANTVCPGYTATERLNDLAENLAKHSNRTPAEIMAGFAESTPARRIGKPDELAALITFLASERAAYITGCSIPVDGGSKRALI
jgi:3-oxoacyl-[acyl-carrier protein] reductase